MTTTPRDILARTSLYAEAAREGGVLLAIFGPIATLEITHSLPWKYALAIWVAAVVMLVAGVELEILVRRKQRESAPIAQEYPQEYYI